MGIMGSSLRKDNYSQSGAPSPLPFLLRCWQQCTLRAGFAMFSKSILVGFGTRTGFDSNRNKPTTVRIVFGSSGEEGRTL